ncbi:hypothetical protein, partial [Eggerthella sinensis]|uniref:hypothetical protein n=1 Tax=Eggerthella sinensis TaxID=242230 RepID=UPI0022E810D7
WPMSTTSTRLSAQSATLTAVRAMELAVPLGRGVLRGPLGHGSLPSAGRRRSPPGSSMSVPL